MEITQEEKEVIKYAFNSFGFLLIDNLNYRLDSFANIIQKHYDNKKVDYCCEILRKHKKNGVVTNKKLTLWITI